MILTDLAKLADSLDKKGETKFADLVDSLMKKYADAETAPEASEEEPAPEEAPVEEVVAVVEAPAEEMVGMLADSWYGEGPEWDLTPICDGEYADTMLDKKDPLPTDPQPAMAVEVKEEAEEDSDDAGDKEMAYEMASKIAGMANELDLKGFTKEASELDVVLEGLNKKLLKLEFSKK